MTREEILALARDAQTYHATETWAYSLAPNQLERFAALVAAHEREECAKVCDRHAADYSVFDRQPYESMEAGAAGCAAAIRARIDG
jgi:nitroreductase